VGEEYVGAVVAFLTNDVTAVGTQGWLVILSATFSTGSQRVLGRNRRRYLARSGPLGAASELPGGVGAERRPVVVQGGCNGASRPPCRSMAAVGRELCRG
jgi:hypothetical protein